MSAIKLALCSSKVICRPQLSLNKFVTISRALKTPAETAQEKNKIESEWNPIYKFRYIQMLSSFNRAKFYQVALTTVAVPISFAFPIVDPLVVATLGVSLTITLSLASYAFSNTVGFIYTSKEQPDKVKFSYLDFWGNRKDVEMKIEDVVPFSEIKQSFLDFAFTNLSFYNDCPKMKLVYKFGGVKNVIEFSKVFGSE